jgi:Flp pilus assembly protein TadD
VSPRVQSARDTLFDALLFVLVFAAYTLTAAPGRSWQDAGEIAAAAHTLGVAHPTGFPTYLLGTKAAMSFPLGEIALRATLVSAFCGALAALIAARLVRALTPSEGPAFAAPLAGMLVAAGATAWTQATVTEVYTPTLAATLLLIALTVRTSRAAGDVRSLFVLAFCAGLATGFHATTRIAGAVAVFALFAHAPSRRVLLRHAGPALACLLAGAAVHLYLPLASANGAALDWGTPKNASDFFGHLSAARIRRAFGDQIGAFDAERLSHHASVYAQQLAETISLAGFALVLLGTIAAFRRERAAAVTLSLLFMGDAAFATLVNPMGMEDRQTGLVGHSVAAMLALVGLSWAGERFARAGPRARFVGFGLVAAGGLALVANAASSAWDEKMRSRDHSAADLVDAALSELPTGALVMTRSDDLSAGIVYARLVEGARPDTLHVVRQHVWQRAALVRGLGALASDTMLAGDRDERIARQTETLRAIVAAARRDGRAIAWESGDDDDAADGAIVPVGLLSEALAAGMPPSLSANAHPPLRVLVSASAQLGRESRRFVASLWDRLGRAFLRSKAGDAMSRAEHAIRNALQIAPEHAPSWNNLGVLLSRTGRLSAAIIAAREATRLAPLQSGHAVNLGLYLLRANDDAAAREAYARARRLAPRDPRVLVGLGILDARAGDYAAARSKLRHALDLGATGDTRADALENLRKLGPP